MFTQPGRPLAEIGRPGTNDHIHYPLKIHLLPINQTIDHPTAEIERERGESERESMRGEERESEKERERTRERKKKKAKE